MDALRRAGFVVDPVSQIQHHATPGETCFDVVVEVPSQDAIPGVLEHITTVTKQVGVEAYHTMHGFSARDDGSWRNVVVLLDGEPLVVCGRGMEILVGPGMDSAQELRNLAMLLRKDPTRLSIRHEDSSID